MAELSRGAAARAYLRRHHAGVLATISQRLAGYPFGSVVPYVLDHQARPVMLFSRLAEHTRNVEADPRVSLLVSDAAGDVQSGARLTLAGDCARVDGDAGALQARYLNYFPEAGRLFALGDFALFHIQPQQLRWIGGFGDMRWIPAEVYSPPANRLADEEQDLLARLNADHAHGLHDCCRHFHGRTAGEIGMAGIDCDGFDLWAGRERPLDPVGRTAEGVRLEAVPPEASRLQPDPGPPAAHSGMLLRIDFEQPVLDAAGAYEAVVSMARRARAS